MHGSELNVLLIERSSSDARAIGELLSVSKAVNFHVEWVERLSTGLERLNSCSFDVVLVDIERPDIDDFKGFQRLCSIASSIPIVMLSDVADEKLALAAVKSGAQDHLVKGEFDADMIERSLRYAIERQRARNALAEKRDALGRSDDLLREQTRILESIMRSIADGVVVADKDGKFLVFNPAAERLVGLGAADLDPDQWSDHYNLYRSDGTTPFPPKSLPLARAMRGETVVDEEVIVRHQNGSVGVLSVNGTPLTDENGELNGGVVVFRDITLQKKADQEIRRLNSELERRVSERTRDLAYMNSELEAFCHSVSHDLRRPLRHIDGFSLELSDKYGQCLDEKGLTYIRKVREGAQRMGQLIDALLELSRTTRGDIRRRSMDLSETARKIALDFQRKEPQREVQFQIADGLSVDGDPVLLQVVLENLISNAWKFTSKHQKARIEFGAKQLNGVPTFYLRDDGVGFDPAFASKLFQPFERLHGENEFDGNGIGLATVQRVIMRHGGHVWAESQPNDGATFFFTLCDTPTPDAPYLGSD